MLNSFPKVRSECECDEYRCVDTKSDEGKKLRFSTADDLPVQMDDELIRQCRRKKNKLLS